MKGRWTGYALVLALLLLAGWLWYRFNGGVSHRDLREAIGEESAAVCARVDSRGDAIERRLERIEDKLDRLLRLAERPPCPDGMRAIENRP